MNTLGRGARSPEVHVVVSFTNISHSACLVLQCLIYELGNFLKMGVILCEIKFVIHKNSVVHRKRIEALCKCLHVMLGLHTFFCNVTQQPC